MDLDSEELEATRKKSADEMFEELGYIKVEDSKMCIKYANDEIDCEINFWKIDKTVSKTHYEKLGYMTMQELKAINKKVEELGW